VSTSTETPTRPTTDAVVAAQDVTRVYGEGDALVHALRGITVQIPRGQFTAVMGPSGSGKSTLMHILAGLDRPTEGTVTIEDRDITAMGDQELTLLRRDHIGFIFQFFNLLPMLTAEENIVLPLRIAGRKLDREWIDEVIGKVGLSDRRSHRPAELSGGQQQRVAIARALAMEPRAILFDEPTSALDPRMTAEVLAVMTDLAHDGLTMIVVTHAMQFARQVAHTVHVFGEGRVIESGPPAQVFEGPIQEATRMLLSEVQAA